MKHTARILALTGIVFCLGDGAHAAETRPTVAVLYFDYGGKSEELAALKKGLAQMMITDLAEEKSVAIVERTRLNEILDELKLSRSAKIDPKTASRVGKLLGARFLVLGSYFDLMGSLRIDARLVAVETGKVELSTGSSGKLDDFLTIEQTMATALREHLASAVTPAHAPSGKEPRGARRGPARLAAGTAAHYGKALEALDHHDPALARKELEEVLRQQPDFQLATTDYKQLSGDAAASRGAQPIETPRAAAAAEAGKRRFFALLLATNKYDKHGDGKHDWPDLVKPVVDARRIEAQLKQYQFETELVADPNLEEMVNAIGKLAEKDCGGGEAIVFIAGHGDRNEKWGEGYLVARDSIRGQGGHTSYLPQSRLRDLLDNFKCEHVLAIIDACHSGTFDQYLASGHGARGDLGAHDMTRDEFIRRSLEFRSRRFITSGRDYLVPDESNFAKRLSEMLETKGGADGILTLSQLEDHISRVTPAPHMGFFGSDRLGGFLFLSR